MSLISAIRSVKSEIGFNAKNIEGLKFSRKKSADAALFGDQNKIFLVTKCSGLLLNSKIFFC